MEKYLLVGQDHLPGKANFFMDGAKIFFEFFEADDDTSAIKKAEKIVNQRRQKAAQDGKIVGATLYHRVSDNKEFVANFPSC